MSMKGAGRWLMGEKMIKLGEQEYHTPFQDIIPALTEQETNALKSDIEQRGILVPVVIDEQANILDGHHRLMIAAELFETKKLKLSQIQWDIRLGLTDEEKRALARDLNLHRRHLTEKQLEALRLRRNGKTYEAIGEELEVGEATARRLVKSVSSQNDETEMPATIKGKDGKEYPATKKRTSILATDTTQMQKTLDSLSGVDTDTLPDKTMTASRAQRVAREAKKEQQADEIEVTIPSTFDLRLGDFREVLADLPDESIDLIFTDPPYSKQYLPLWLDMAKLAARVLKPGKLLIAYSGQFWLNEVLSYLGEYLDYVWLGALTTPGQHCQINQRHVRSACKPLLFFARAPYEKGEWFDDLFENPTQEKDLHEWQQGIAPAEYYIGKLTKPGDKVFDPFVGSGTTGVATVGLNRFFVGAEKKETDYKIALQRIQEVKGDDPPS